MDKPIEYENLIRTRSFKAAVRNRVTYRDPIPPVTKADSTAMQAILARMLPAAKSLIGLD